MAANPLKSSSDLCQKSQRMKPPPLPSPHHLEAKTFSSRRLSSSSISLSRYLYPSELRDDEDGDYDDDGHQLYGHGGTTASIPFTWESQPGTPKVRFRDDIVPTLKPPPCYLYTPPRDTNNAKQQLKTKFVTAILPKLRSSSPASPTSSSSSSSLWSSVPPSPAVGGRARRSVSRLSLPTRGGKWEQEHEDHVPSPCFSLGRRGTNARPRRCYLAMIRALRGKFP